jgi:photosystem II S4 domain protein
MPGAMPIAFKREVVISLEKAKRAERVWSLEQTDFYSPPLREWIMKAIKKNFSEQIVKCDSFGGFEGAEMQRVLISRAENSYENFEEAKRDEFDGDGKQNLNCAVSCVEISGKFAFDPATHPDFLGAVLNSGVKREKIGDILVNSKSSNGSKEGAKVLCTPAIAVFLTRALETVRTVKVNVDIFPLTELEAKAIETEQFRTYEASLRLDSIASAGFRCARSKMCDDISKGLVKLNYNICDKKNAIVKAGDMLSCRGRGRVEVLEILEQENDRYRIELLRYK